jgi:hypothetical protein
MTSKLFTKEYLCHLQKECEKFTIFDYIMKSEGKSFHDAIMRLSHYCKLKPEYIANKEEK